MSGLNDGSYWPGICDLANKFSPIYIYIYVTVVKMCKIGPVLRYQTCHTLFKLAADTIGLYCMVLFHQSWIL